MQALEIEKSVSKEEKQLDSKKKNKSLLVREGEVRKAMYTQKPILVLMYKGAYMSINETNPSLPRFFVALLQDF